MLAFIPDAKIAAAAQGLPETLVFSLKESCMQLAKEVRSGFWSVWRMLICDHS